MADFLDPSNAVVASAPTSAATPASAVKDPALKTAKVLDPQTNQPVTYEYRYPKALADASKEQKQSWLQTQIAKGALLPKETKEVFDKLETQYKLERGTLAAHYWAESTYGKDPKTDMNPASKGAAGPMQLQPSAVADIKGKLEDRVDLQKSADMMAQYLAKIGKGLSHEDRAAAYNQGRSGSQKPENATAVTKYKAKIAQGMLIYNEQYPAIQAPAGRELSPAAKEIAAHPEKYGMGGTNAPATDTSYPSLRHPKAPITSWKDAAEAEKANEQPMNPVLKAGLIGAVTAAAAPELTMAGGLALGGRAIPSLVENAGLISKVGQSMVEAAGAMSKAPTARAALAVLGFGSEAAGEGIGEAIEKRSPVGAEIARQVIPLAASFGVLEGGALVDAYVKGPTKTLWKAAQMLVGREVDNTPSAAKTVLRNLQGAVKSGVPDNDLHLMMHDSLKVDEKVLQAQLTQLQHSTQQQVAAAGTPAEVQKIQDKAAAAAKELHQHFSDKLTVINKASEGKVLNAPAISKITQAQLGTLGDTEVAPHVNGKGLQQLADTQETALQQARRATDAPLRAALTGKAGQELSGGYKVLDDGIVTKLQASGQFPGDTPEIAQLVSRLKSEAGLGIEGSLSEHVSVSDPSQLAAYKRMISALEPMRRDPATGGMVAKAADWDALMGVNRKLKASVNAVPNAENFAALTRDTNLKISKEIDAALTKFVGEPGPNNPYTKMQDNYLKHSEQLALHKSATGQKLTRTDAQLQRAAEDLEIFHNDPARIPSTFFKSDDSVRLLRQLINDDAAVDKAALTHAIGSEGLRGKGAEETQKWLADPKNRLWLKEIPGLTGKLEAHSQRLSEITGNMEQRIAAQQKLTAEKANLLKEKSTAFEKLSDEGQAAFKRLTAPLRSHMEGGTGTGYAREDVRKVIKEGDRELQTYMVETLNRRPGGQKVLLDTLRGQLSGAKSADELTRVWDNRWGQLLPTVRTMPQEEVRQIDSLVQQAKAAFAKGDKAAALNFTQRMERLLTLRAAAGGVGMAARAVSGKQEEE